MWRIAALLLVLILAPGCGLLTIGVYPQWGSDHVAPEVVRSRLPRFVVGSEQDVAEVASFAVARIDSRETVHAGEVYLEIESRFSQGWPGIQQLAIAYDLIVAIPNLLIAFPPLVDHWCGELDLVAFDAAGRPLGRGHSSSRMLLLGTIALEFTAGDLSWYRRCKPDMGAALDDLARELAASD